MTRKPFDFASLAKFRKNTYEFSSLKVQSSAISKILESARWAPSCQNAQPWHFIVVRRKGTIRRLVNETHHIFFPFLNPLPPAIIVFVLESSKFVEAGVCKGSSDLGVGEAHMCVAMAAMNAALQATDLGLASCILTPKNGVKRILGIPEGNGVPLMLGIGFERTGAFRRLRERKKLGQVVSFERYGAKK